VDGYSDRDGDNAGDEPGACHPAGHHYDSLPRCHPDRLEDPQVMDPLPGMQHDRIEHAQSLKDRRQVVRSLKDQLRQGFNISVAEMDEAHVWQSATIGVVAISHSRSYLQGLIDEVERAARRILNEHGAEMADSFWDYIET